MFNRSEDINARMRDLLTVVGCTERLLTGGKTFAGEPIAYESIQKNLYKKIAGSKLYIDSVLGGARKYEEKNLVCD